MSKIISVTKFFAKNPLWKLLKQKDGKTTASYKSNTVNCLIECKKCGEQAERRGTAKYKCLRCRRDVAVTQDGVVSIVEPTDDKELKFREAGMAREPKKIYDEDLAEDLTEDEDDEEEEPAPVPVKKKSTKKKTEDLVPIRKKKSKKDVVPVEESDEEEEDKSPSKDLFMDLDVLADFASKTSGNLTEAEKTAKKATIEKKIVRRQIKKEAATDDIIPEEDAPTTSTTNYVPIVPAKKLRDAPKLDECSGLVKKEIVLKSGDTYFVAEIGLMIRVE